MKYDSRKVYTHVETGFTVIRWLRPLQKIVHRLRPAPSLRLLAPTPPNLKVARNLLQARSTSPAAKIITRHISQSKTPLRYCKHGFLQVSKLLANRLWPATKPFAQSPRQTRKGHPSPRPHWYVMEKRRAAMQRQCVWYSDIAQARVVVSHKSAWSSWTIQAEASFAT